jgi:hypothetical protein
MTKTVKNVIRGGIQKSTDSVVENLPAFDSICVLAKKALFIGLPKVKRAAQVPFPFGTYLTKPWVLRSKKGGLLFRYLLESGLLL